MARVPGVYISGAVEGLLDDAVARRLMEIAGGRPGPIHIKYGKGQLLQKLSGYNSAAEFTPWLVLVDLDHDDDCAPAFCTRWLPAPANHMCFRVAVREVE